MCLAACIDRRTPARLKIRRFGNFKGRQSSTSTMPIQHAQLSKKHANNLQLKMCQVAKSIRRKSTLFIIYDMYRLYVHIKYSFYRAELRSFDMYTFTLCFVKTSAR